MQALVLTGPQQAVVRTLPDPEPASDEILVAVEAVGICGTDLELWRGTMPYLRQGRSRYPLVPGHEWVGTVVATGRDVFGLRPGIRVSGETVIGCGACGACRAGRPALCAERQEVGILGRNGALAEFLTIPARSVHILPVDRPEIGVFAEPQAVAATGLARLGPLEGQELWVHGLGTLGTLTGAWASRHGARVYGCDVRPARRRHFERAGGHFVADWAVRAQAHPQPVLAVEASGSPSGLTALLEQVPPGSRICLLGLPEPHSLDIAQVAFRHLQLTGFIGTDPDVWGTVGDYLARGVLRPTEWFDLNVVSLDELPRALADAAAGHASGMKLICRVAAR
jgi:2-desacetyl-2-hydroxyethyl bacteriochlorophyllide A dehydrogenase